MADYTEQQVKDILKEKLMSGEITKDQAATKMANYRSSLVAAKTDRNILIDQYKEAQKSGDEQARRLIGAKLNLTAKNVDVPPIPEGKLTEETDTKGTPWIQAASDEPIGKLGAVWQGIKKEFGETGLGVLQRLGMEGVLGEGITPDLMQRVIDEQARPAEEQQPYSVMGGEMIAAGAEFAPAFAAAPLTVPALAAEGAVYGLTRPTKESEGAAKVAKNIATEAASSVVFGKAFQIAGEKLAKPVWNFVKRKLGKAPENLLGANGEVSPQLQDALDREGINLKEFLEKEGLYDAMSDALKATDSEINADQAIRAARFDALSIEPRKAAITQSFDQSIEEQRLIRQMEGMDPNAAEIRSQFSRESQGFKDALSNLADEMGVPAKDAEGLLDFGDLVRDAIKGRKSLKMTEKREAYEHLAEIAAEKGEKLPIIPDAINDIYLSTKKIKRSQSKELHRDSAEIMMRYGIVEPDEAFKKLIKAGEEEVESLSLGNFETMRQDLNALLDPKDPTTSAVIKPIIRSIDKEADLMVDSFKGAGEVLDAAVKARNLNREIKTEFDSSTFVSKYMKLAKGQFDQHQIQSQTLFKKLVKDSKKSPSIEELDNILNTLGQSGPKGQRAIADLQATTIGHILEQASKSQAKMSNGGTPFSHISFMNAMDNIGTSELNRIFKSNPSGLQMLKEIRKASVDSQVYKDAIPIGSANDMQNFWQRTLYYVMGAKAGPAGALAANAMLKKGSDKVKAKKLQKIIKETLKASPEKRAAFLEMSDQYPNLFALAGISAGTVLTDNAIDETKQAIGAK